MCDRAHVYSALKWHEGNNVFHGAKIYFTLLAYQILIGMGSWQKFSD